MNKNRPAIIRFKDGATVKYDDEQRITTVSGDLVDFTEVTRNITRDLFIYGALALLSEVVGPGAFMEGLALFISENKETIEGSCAATIVQTSNKEQQTEVARAAEEIKQRVEGAGNLIKH